VKILTCAALDWECVNLGKTLNCFLITKRKFFVWA